MTQSERPEESGSERHASEAASYSDEGSPSLITKLKERKVAPWGVAYLAVAAVVIEVSDVLGANFGWPPAFVRGLIGAVGVGFFVTLVLAWFHGRSGHQQITGREILSLSSVLVAGGLVVTMLSVEGTGSASPGSLADRAGAEGFSIAVLPFTSPDSGEEDALFTEGVHDQIIVQLSKIADLRVLSRAAVRPYAEAAVSSQEIASGLGARFTIEGGVRRDGDRIRISVSLVEAATGENWWAESYDAEYGASELFEIQSDVAVSVADALRATLTVEERSAITEIPTDDIDALESYTTGVALRNRAATSATMERAVLHFRDALAADPDFLHAWTGLAETLLYIHHNIDDSPTRLEEALVALARAEALDPDHPRLHMVRGLYHYRAESDFRSALGEFVIAQRGLPNDPELLQSVGLVQRRMRLTEAAAESFRSALELDPRNVNLHVDLAVTLLLLRRFEDAAVAYERALELEPLNDWAIAGLALARLPVDPDGARRLLRTHMPNSDYASDWAWGLAAAALGEYELWRARVDRLTGRELVHQAAFHPRSLVRAWSEDALGNKAAARASYDSAADHLSTRLQQTPDDGRVMAALGLALAGLDRADEAVRLGRRALEVPPFDRDLYLAPIVREDLAKIYAMSGEAELALDEIEALLAEPGYLTRARLRGDWIWRDIRDHSRFERLSRGH